MFSCVYFQAPIFSLYRKTFPSTIITRRKQVGKIWVVVPLQRLVESTGVGYWCLYAHLHSTGAKWTMSAESFGRWLKWDERQNDPHISRIVVIIALSMQAIEQSAAPPPPPLNAYFRDYADFMDWPYSAAGRLSDGRPTDIKRHQTTEDGH